MEVILSKLALIEAQQRHQGQLLQQILAAVKRDSEELCELPEGVSLPVQTIAELADMDKHLENANNSKQLVISHIISVCLCMIYLSYSVPCLLSVALLGCSNSSTRRKPDSMERIKTFHGSQ